MATMIVTSRVTRRSRVTGMNIRNMILALRVGPLMRDEVTFEGEFHATLARHGHAAEFFVVSQVDFDVKPFTAFPARVLFLALRVLPPEMSPELVESYKTLHA